MTVRIFVGLGSNLKDPVHQLRLSFDALTHLPSTRFMARSALYRNPPMGPSDQPDFVNAVVALETELSPLAVLRHLQAIESQQGRVRDGMRWGPRTLDLDLLLYGDEQIEDIQLTVPHPGLHERAFVLVPLQEIVPAVEIPGSGSLDRLLNGVSRRGLRVIAGV